MAAPLKISTLVTIDATQAKAGGSEAQRAIEGMGQSADTTSTKIQQLIARSAGIGSGAANQNIREWNGALAMQGRSLDELRAKYNPMFAVINQYKASLTEIRTLHAQGVLSTNEMTAAISRQRQATLSSIDAIKGRNSAMRGSETVAFGGGQAFQSANIFAQFQDIGVTSAMGMHPLMIALQQGTQLSSVVGSMERPLAGILSAFRMMVSPVSLVTIGLTAAAAAAIQYFMSADEGAKKANGSLGEHEELVKEVARKWGEAIPSLKAYVDQLERAKAAGDLQQAADAAAIQMFGDSSTGLADLNIMENGLADLVIQLRQAGAEETTILALQSAWNSLGESIRKGKADQDSVLATQDALTDAINQTGIPGVQEFAKRFGELATNIATAAKNAEVLRKEALLARIGQFPSPGTYGGVTRTPDGNIQNPGFTLPEIGPTPAPRGTPELSGFPGEKERLDAARERQRSRDESIAGQRLELSLIGQTTSAIEAQRMEARLLAEVRAEAARNGTTVSDEEVRKIREASVEYGRLAEAIAAANALRGQTDQIDQLQLEISLIGRREDESRRALALALAQQQIRDRGISAQSAEAALYRSNAVEAENLKMKLEQVKDAWGSIQSAGESAIDSFVDGLASGDIEGALESISQDITKTFLQLGVANPLKNAIFGTNYGTLSDAGGVLSGLFGGATAGAAGSSVGSMSVTAASVIINGGVAGSGLFGQGVAGLASNQNMQGSISAYAAAIRQIESSGNYQAMGPLTKSGDRAYGAYQVMGANIPSWTKGALGQVLSPQQFLSSPSAQDAVFNKYFGQSLSKFGNANDAASVWFTGRPLSSGGDASDILGTTGKAYVDKFNAALGQVTNTAGAANQNLGQFGNSLGGLGSALQNVSTGIGSGGGGGLSGWLSSLFGIGGGSQWAAAASGSIVGLFADGGYTGAGGKYQPAGVAHKGEVIWSQDDVARAGGWQVVDAMRLGRRGYASGGPVGIGRAANSNLSGGGQSSIVVNNYSSAKVETEEQSDDRGGRQTIFTLSDAVGDALSRKGGGANKAMNSQFGVRRKGRRR